MILTEAGQGALRGVPKMGVGGRRAKSQQESFHSAQERLASAGEEEGICVLMEEEVLELAILIERSMKPHPADADWHPRKEAPNGRAMKACRPRSGKKNLRGV